MQKTTSIWRCHWKRPWPAWDAESELVSLLDWDFRLTSDQWGVCVILTECALEKLSKRESDRKGERKQWKDFRTNFLEAESAELPAGSGMRANQLMSHTPWAGFNNLYSAGAPEWLEISFGVPKKSVYVRNLERERNRQKWVFSDKLLSTTQFLQMCYMHTKQETYDFFCTH